VTGTEREYCYELKGLMYTSPGGFGSSGVEGKINANKIL